MTVTHDVNMNQSRNWGADRVIEIQKGGEIGLGFSIIGGQIDGEVHGNGQKSSGVFIKSINPEATTSAVRNLKIGDRIVEVNGVNTLDCTSDKVAEIIEKNGNTLRLRVQSLTLMDRQYSEPRIGPKLKEIPKSTSVARSHGERTTSFQSEMPATSTPSLNNNAIVAAVDSKNDNEKVSNGNPAKHSESEESSDEEDERYLEGKINTKAGMEISRRSAGNVKRSAAEIAADPEQEDDFGYTAQKILKKYRALSGQVVLASLERPIGELGIALAGHKDRSKMATFVCGLNPKGHAYKAGTLKVGDEILEVNGHVLQGRCHLNASVVIKGMGGSTLKIVIHRADTNALSVEPLTHFPAAFDDSDRFSDFDGVRTVSMKKGMYGLGIMIVEGKHAIVGQGIFISDVQVGSVAEKGGLEVGDMILGVNSDNLVGCTHDQATAILKRAEGMVTIAVCNPNQKQKEEAKEKEQAKAAAGATGATGATSTADGKPAEPVKPEVVKPKAKSVTVEITKAKEAALGLIISGGSDTKCGGVFILDLYPDGLADKSGQLKRGDQILEFCQENFKTVTREKAELTILSATGVIKMNVMQDEDFTEQIDVELQRKPLKGIGLGLTGFKSGKGAYISELMVGGSALESAKLELGDSISAIGGQNVEETATDEIADILKASTPVQVKVKRFKAKA